ncbi:reverse transcriptase [Trichonephila clavipes]|nr:reverse transcriptase [Trichonephila clavipes]
MSTVVGPFPRHLERAGAVARFCLTTGHNFWGVYLHWLDLTVEEVFSLCGHTRMDHLLQCIGLNEYPTDVVVSRYFIDRLEMARKPQPQVLDK